MHTLFEHNVWNYNYFLAYIIKKEQTEYTGIESYVRHCYDHSDISWFPQYQALSFQGQEKNSQKRTLENLKEVEEAVETIERESNEAKRKMVCCFGACHFTALELMGYSSYEPTSKEIIE